MVLCNASGVTGGDSVNTVRFLRGSDHTDCDPFCLLMESYNERPRWDNKDGLIPSENHLQEAKQHSETVSPVFHHKECEFQGGEDAFDSFDRTVPPFGPPTSPPQFAFNDKRKTRDMRAQLKAIFKQLARASEGNGGILNRGGIDKTVLLDFVADVPGLLGERLFQLFDKNRDNKISFEEFVGGLKAAYAPDADTRMRFLFDLYDLDGNGVVDRSELFSLLYNLPADLWLNTPYPIVGSALRRDRNPHSNVSLTDEEKKTLVRRVVNLVFDQVYPPHQSGPEAHPGSSATNIGESKGDTRVGNVEQELLCHLMPSAPLRAEDFETAESTSSYRQWSPRCLNADVDDGLSLTFEQFTRAAQAIPELLSLLQLFDSHSLRPLLAHYSGQPQTLTSSQPQTTGPLSQSASAAKRSTRGEASASLPPRRGEKNAGRIRIPGLGGKHLFLARLLLGSSRFGQFRRARVAPESLEEKKLCASSETEAAAAGACAVSALTRSFQNPPGRLCGEDALRLSDLSREGRGQGAETASPSSSAVSCALLRRSPSFPTLLSKTKGEAKDRLLQAAAVDADGHEAQRAVISKAPVAGVSGSDERLLSAASVAESCSADFCEVPFIPPCQSAPPASLEVPSRLEYLRREDGGRGEAFPEFVGAAGGEAAASIIAANSDAEGWLWKRREFGFSVKRPLRVEERRRADGVCRESISMRASDAEGRHLGLWIQRYYVLKERLLYCKDLGRQVSPGSPSARQKLRRRVCKALPRQLCLATFSPAFPSPQAECASAALLLREFSVAPHSERLGSALRAHALVQSTKTTSDAAGLECMRFFFVGAPTFCTSTRVRKEAEGALLFGFDVSASDGQTVKTLYAASPQDRERWMQALRLSLSTPSFHDFYCLDTQTLGRGRFSVVRAATHRLSQRRVAVKILNKKRLVQISNRDAVRTEIEILRLLDHPNVVPFVEAFESPEYFYLVFALAEHSDLRSLLTLARQVQASRPPLCEESLKARPLVGTEPSDTAAGLLPEGVTRKILRSLLRGLAHVHEKGVVHRDVKPSNLLLDFGARPDSAAGVGSGSFERASLEAHEATRLVPEIKGHAAGWASSEGGCCVAKEEAASLRDALPPFPLPPGEDASCRTSLNSNFRHPVSVSVAAAPRASALPNSRSKSLSRRRAAAVATGASSPDAETVVGCMDSSPSQGTKTGSAPFGSAPKTKAKTVESLCIQVISPSHSVLAQIHPHAQTEASCAESGEETLETDAREALSATNKAQQQCQQTEVGGSCCVSPASSQGRSSREAKKKSASPASSASPPAALPGNPRGRTPPSALKGEAVCRLTAIRKALALLRTPRAESVRSLGASFSPPFFKRPQKALEEKSLKGEGKRGGEASAERGRRDPCPPEASFAEADAELREKQAVFADACARLKGVTLADFGLAAFLGPKWSATQTLGTLAYAAPEVLLHEKYDFGVDLWSVGVIAYELLTSGKMPFEAETSEELTKKIISIDFPRKAPDGSWIIRGESARHFVESLLCSREERLDCKEALAHPFLTEEGALE